MAMTDTPTETPITKRKIRTIYISEHRRKNITIYKNKQKTVKFD